MQLLARTDGRSGQRLLEEAYWKNVTQVATSMGQKRNLLALQASLCFSGSATNILDTVYFTDKTRFILEYRSEALLIRYCYALSQVVFSLSKAVFVISSISLSLQLLSMVTFEPSCSWTDYPLWRFVTIVTLYCFLWFWQVAHFESTLQLSFISARTPGE